MNPRKQQNQGQDTVSGRVAFMPAPKGTFRVTGVTANQDFLCFGLNQKATSVSWDSAQLPVGTTSTRNRRVSATTSLGTLDFCGRETMANTTLFSSIKSKFVRTDTVNEAGGWA